MQTATSKPLILMTHILFILLANTFNATFITQGLFSKWLLHAGQEYNSGWEIMKTQVFIHCLERRQAIYWLLKWFSLKILKASVSSMLAYITKL